MLELRADRKNKNGMNYEANKKSTKS